VINTPAVLAIVRGATLRNPEDINHATDLALAEIKRLPDYLDLVEPLLRQAVKGLVHDCRSSMNTEILQDVVEHPNREPEQPEQPAPAPRRGTPCVVGNSPTLQMHSVFNLFMCGTRLGSLRGRDIPVVSGRCRSNAATQVAYANLLDRLEPLTPPDSRIEEAVAELTARGIVAETLGAEALEAALV
jgi:hypothetical protein